MTVIAWDGKTLAADKRGTFGGLSRRVTKIFVVHDELVGIAGNACEGYDLIAWIEGGCKLLEFPVNQRDEKLWAECLVIARDGSVRIYQRSPNACYIHDRFTAIGSGRDFALAAMHLGKSAREAVEVACVFDTGCGNGVDTIQL